MNFLDYNRKSLHRNQLEEYVVQFAPGLEGTILDIGSKNRRYDYLLKNKPVAIDIIENKEKEVKYDDVNNLSFENESFDSIICLEVFEYILTPQKAISEIYRVLKEN